MDAPLSPFISHLQPLAGEEEEQLGASSPAVTSAGNMNLLYILLLFQIPAYYPSFLLVQLVLYLYIKGALPISAVGWHG